MGHNYGVEFDLNKLIVETAVDPTSETSEPITNIEQDRTEYLVDQLSELSLSNIDEPMKKFKTKTLHSEVLDLERKLELVQLLRSKAFPNPKTQEKHEQLKTQLREVKRMALKKIVGSPRDKTL